MAKEAGRAESKTSRYDCIDKLLSDNDQLKTNTALQMEAANLSAYGGD